MIRSLSTTSVISRLKNVTSFGVTTNLVKIYRKWKELLISIP
jgi:hypothetical protein